VEQKISTVGAIDRALDILDFLYTKGGKAKIHEISAALGMYQSTVHRAVTTLKNRGYVYQDQVDSSYGIGQRFFLLGTMFQEKNLLANIIRPRTLFLSEKYGECVHVSIPEAQDKNTPKHVTILQENASNSVLSIMPSLGIPAASHCSASGKCILAFSQKPYLEKFIGCNLKRFTEFTITDWTSLLEELESIRKVGYGTDHGELELGLMCIAVPILDEYKNAIGAISLVGPEARLNLLDQAAVVRDLHFAIDDLFCQKINSDPIQGNT
jgi:DNA-binding IclR family transcriptional regulator